MVRRDPVVPPDNKVAEVLAGDELLGPFMPVEEGNGSAVRNTETPVDPARRIFLEACLVYKLIFRTAARSAGPRIDGLIFTRMGSLQSAKNILSRASTRIKE